MNLFNSVRINRPKFNGFNLSHDFKLTGQLGTLIPILCEPVVPGDVFSINTSILLRFAPLAAPIISNVDVYTHFFYCPNRILWDGWNDFIADSKPKKRNSSGVLEEKEPPLYPRITWDANFLKTMQDRPQFTSLFCEGSLMDYLGFPAFSSHEGYPSSLAHFIEAGTANPVAPAKIELDALPFRMYSLIYNEYYRDENLQDEIDIMKDVNGVVNDSSAALLLMSLRQRDWRKDYFTSALPFPQAGEDVRLPLYGEGSITGKGRIVYDSNSGDTYLRSSGNLPSVPDGSSLSAVRPANSSGAVNSVGFDLSSLSSSERMAWEGQLKSGHGLGVDNSSSLRVDTTSLKVDGDSLSAATINELRRAIRVQEFKELEARGGHRLKEMIAAFFGQNVPDARLQRPIYLGGGRTPVVVSEVLQTSQTTTGDNGSPQGTPSGTAASLGTHGMYKKKFVEHGWIMCILSVVPKPEYQQGLPRKYFKFDRFDHYWPTFQHLGEQEILNKEIYSDPTDGKDDEVFGYTPRYAEYKFCPNRVAGDFRTSLNFWHLGRIFENRPLLNSDFVTCNPSTRIFAVDDSDQPDPIDKLWISVHHDFKAVRPMSRYGTPRL